jgi:hypothetical protein
MTVGIPITPGDIGLILRTEIRAERGDSRPTRRRERAKMGIQKEERGEKA